MKDNISDMLTRIRNGQQTKLKEVSLFWPTPKVCLEILKLLEKEGYIYGYKYKIIEDKEVVVVLLKYNQNEKAIISKIERISKPGKRIFSKVTNFWKVNNGKGTFIISTSRGLITDRDARFLNIGGEIICYVE